MNLSGNVSKTIFIVVALCCLTPAMPPSVPLILGVLYALTLGNPFSNRTKSISTILLQCSVVGLGLGLNLDKALQASKDGFLLAAGTIVGTMIVGVLLGRMLKIESKTSYLISSGTAICGGSAIAAVAPVIKAESTSITIAVAIVFILNGVAQYVFPPIGHALHLTQSQFGVWCAVAIHDTSSVVSAAFTYGNEALQTATTLKLTRALWIVPLTLVTSLLQRSGKATVKIPYFILGFIAAVCVSTYVPAIAPVSVVIVAIAKACLKLTLFLIGAALNRQSMSQVGFAPFIQGLTLWILISSVALFAVLAM